MKPPKTRTGRIGATLVLLMAAAFLGAARPAPKSPATNTPVSVTPAGSHLIGNPQAPVRLVEYISYTCSHCAAFDAEGALPLQTGYLATGKVLLDREMDHPVVEEIREAIETSAQTRVTDLHVWRVGKQVFSCALTVVTQEPDLTPTMVRQRLSVHEEIVHSTIEIHRYQRRPA